MARTIPEERFSELVRAATSVFIALGYQRTQMADVAAAAGVAKGTLYVYVEGKEALFELCARYCDDAAAVPRPEHLPYPTPPAGAVRRMLAERLQRAGRSDALQAALSKKRARDARAELSGILGELFDSMHRNRYGIRLIDRCSGDHPELPNSLQRQQREGLQGELASYLEMRARGRQPRTPADASLLGRVVIETLTTWAVHIYWDSLPQRFEPERARGAVIEFVLGGLLRGPQR